MTLCDECGFTVDGPLHRDFCETGRRAAGERPRLGAVLNDAIREGLARAEALRLTKRGDVSTIIRANIERAMLAEGWRFTRRPRRSGEPAA